MKKIIVLLLCTTVLFCGLWIREITDYSDKEELCQYYAEQAAGHLSEYQKFKDINDENYIGQYWGSVSIFYAFKETLHTLPDDGGWNEIMYKNCDVVYDHMLLAPEEILEHLNEAVAAFKLVGEDYDSFEARSAMSELSYNLQYVWE